MSADDVEDLAEDLAQVTIGNGEPAAAPLAPWQAAVAALDLGAEDHEIIQQLDALNVPLSNRVLKHIGKRVCKCISCFHQYDTEDELVQHLRAKRDHIYGQKNIREEKKDVRERVSAQLAAIGPENVMNFLVQTIPNLPEGFNPLERGFLAIDLLHGLITDALYSSFSMVVMKCAFLRPLRRRLKE